MTCWMTGFRSQNWQEEMGGLRGWWWLNFSLWDQANLGPRRWLSLGNEIKDLPVWGILLYNQQCQLTLLYTSFAFSGITSAFQRFVLHFLVNPKVQWFRMYLPLWPQLKELTTLRLKVIALLMVTLWVIWRALDIRIIQHHRLC